MTLKLELNWSFLGVRDISKTQILGHIHNNNNKPPGMCHWQWEIEGVLTYCPFKTSFKPPEHPTRELGRKLKSALKEQLRMIHEKIEAQKIAEMALAEVRSILAKEEEERQLVNALELKRQEVAQKAQEMLEAQLREEREQEEKRQLEKEKLEKERTEKEKAELERMEKERLEKDRERLERERVAKEKAEKERLEKERVAKEKAEKERLERERVAKEKAEKERLERERVAKEKAEKERLEKERVAKEKAEKERIEKERVAKEKMGTCTLINAPIDTPAEAFIKIVGAFISV
uniref:Uncharacterized protein n=1 Tax=Oncorhynchus kisutch TaxID=8019 RepID=A0A8C7L9J3_ONCKI